MALTRAARACANGHAYAPDCECTRTIEAPILSSKAESASTFICVCKTRFSSPWASEDAYWSKVGSPGSPLPGHWVCSAACGQSLNFSCAMKRDAEFERSELRIGPLTAVRNPDRARPG